MWLVFVFTWNCNSLYCINFTYCKDMQEPLYVPATVHREQSVKREETNKVQQLDVYY